MLSWMFGSGRPPVDQAKDSQDQWVLSRQLWTTSMQEAFTVGCKLTGRGALGIGQALANRRATVKVLRRAKWMAFMVVMIVFVGCGWWLVSCEDCGPAMTFSLVCDAEGMVQTRTLRSSINTPMRIPQLLVFRYVGSLELQDFQNFSDFIST